MMPISSLNLLDRGFNVGLLHSSELSEESNDWSVGRNGVPSSSAMEKCSETILLFAHGGGGGDGMKFLANVADSCSNGDGGVWQRSIPMVK